MNLCQKDRCVIGLCDKSVSSQHNAVQLVHICIAAGHKDNGNLKLLPDHRVPGVEHLDLRAGAVHDLVEQGLGEGVAIVHIRHVEEHPALPPVVGEAGGDGGVVGVVQYIAAQQHGEAQRLRRGDGQILSGDHIGDQSYVAAGEIGAAALIVQNVGAGAGSQINSLPSEGVPGIFREKAADPRCPS